MNWTFADGGYLEAFLYVAGHSRLIQECGSAEDTDVLLFCSTFTFTFTLFPLPSLGGATVGPLMQTFLPSLLQPSSASGSCSHTKVSRRTIHHPYSPAVGILHLQCTPSVQPNAIQTR